MPKITNEILAPIRKFMRETGSSQQDAAYRIGVTLASLNSWITGRQKKISPSSVRLIQNFFEKIKVKL